MEEKEKDLEQVQEQTQEQEKKKEKAPIDVNTLIKYPLITVCVVGGLFIGTAFMGLDLSEISSISASGIQFKQEQDEASKKAITTLVSQVTALEQEVSSLRSGVSTPIIQKAPGQSGIVPANQGGSVLEVDYTATETVAPYLANLSYVNAKGDTNLKGESGFIWLGEYDARKGAWSNMPLRTSSRDRQLTASPGEIQMQQYRTSDNIVLRANMLNENNDNLQNNTIGFIPQGTLLKLKCIDKVGEQYWGEVLVEE